MNTASAEKPGIDGVCSADEVFAGPAVEVTTGVGSGVGQGGGVVCCVCDMDAGGMGTIRIGGGIPGGRY